MKYKDYKVYHLCDGDRLRADITPFGGRLVRLLFDGVDVVQGFDKVEDYLPERHLSDFGAIVGRYANRLAEGRIVVDGQTYQLPQNNGRHCLHGGPHGWQYSLFDVVAVDGNRIELSLVSPDGDNGFPGAVTARVVYTLADGALHIDYTAVSDRPTVINLTNHSYFNLSGDLSSCINDHRLRIDADRYTPTDETAIPREEHEDVEGTPFDFRKARAIGLGIDMDDCEQIRIGHGYDHNFVLNHRSGYGGLDFAAELACLRSGIVMRVYTDAPGLQLYTGNFLDGEVGKGGVAYPRRSAVCLETQQYPDSPNRQWPESTGRLLPDKPFESRTIFQFDRD